MSERPGGLLREPMEVVLYLSHQGPDPTRHVLSGNESGLAVKIRRDSPQSCRLVTDVELGPVPGGPVGVQGRERSPAEGNIFVFACACPLQLGDPGPRVHGLLVLALGGQGLYVGRGARRLGARPPPLHVTQQPDAAGGRDALEPPRLREALGPRGPEDVLLDQAEAVDGVVVEVRWEAEVLVPRELLPVAQLARHVGGVGGLDADAGAHPRREPHHLRDDALAGQHLDGDVGEPQDVQPVAPHRVLPDAEPAAQPRLRREVVALQDRGQVRHGLLLVRVRAPPPVRHYAPLPALGGQPRVGVVRARREAVLAPTRKHAPLRRPAGVDASYDALPGGLLVPRRAVNLPREPQAPNGLGLERRAQAARVDVVVLHAVSRLEHGDVLQPDDRAEELLLRVGGDRHGQPIGVDDVVVEALGLEPDDVLLLVAETDDLGLEGRAVPRALDRLPDVYRLVQVRTDDVVRRRVGVGRVTEELVLYGDRVVEERPRRDDNVVGRYYLPRLKPDTRNLALRAQAGARLPLHHIAHHDIRHAPQHHAQPRIIRQLLPHMFLVQRAVDLRPGPPHRRALLPVQHLELHARLVDDPAGQPVQRVDLAQDGALADAAEGRVAAAHAQVVELGRDERRARPGPGGRRAGLGARVAASYYHDVVGPVEFFARRLG
ncbi:hypothetical protein VM1G_11282 [Cytospora mali]|uniref:Uncharacterized protein n=1 Tax=Cytospora mali TaxID=578113 RepID=A0A194VMW4_CYTMA|nr:hypothetical protein VM1G_11282 [Valsa mali]